MQAAEALKLIMGIGEPLHARLLLMDVLNMQIRTVRLSKDPGCNVCGVKSE
jgi:adenylyltransferase/sulfurtransferase